MKKAFIIMGLIISAKLFFTDFSYASNEICDSSECESPCVCCSAVEVDVSADDTPRIMTGFCPVECSDFQKIQMKIELITGDITCSMGPGHYPSSLDDDKDGDLDYVDVTSEIQKLLNISTNQALFTANALK